MEINLTVTVSDVQAMLNGLSKLPLEQSADAFFKVKAQAEQQIAAQQALEQGDGTAAGGTD